MSLPKWVDEIKCTSAMREPIESERLIKALAIAMEALEYLKRAGCPECRKNQIARHDLTQINALGEKR